MTGPRDQYEDLSSDVVNHDKGVWEYLTDEEEFIEDNVDYDYQEEDYSD